MVRYGESGAAHEHQGREVRPLLGQPLPVREEPVRALVAVDAPDVEDVRRGQPEAGTDVDVAVALRDVDAAAHHDRRHRRVAAHPLHEAALLGREVDDPARAPEEVAEDGQLDGGILLRRRHQHRAIAHGGQAEEALVVAVRVEDEEVHVREAAQRPHELGALGPVLDDPLALVLERVLLVEHEVRDEREAVLVARPLHGMARDGQAVDAVGARRIVVAPLEVVQRAGGHDAHVVPPREPSGQPAAVQLGAARDLDPEALDDEAETETAARVSGHARRRGDARIWP